MITSTRVHGAFTRQLFLGDTLDAERRVAGYETGVLTLRIPVAESAKPARPRSPKAPRPRPPWPARSPNLGPGLTYAIR